MTNIKQNLPHILEQHRLWLRRCNGTRAVLTGAVLRDADLRDADLAGAVLRDADLRDADLRDADLTGAVLTGADLRDADLRDAVLTGADLIEAAQRSDGYRFYANTKDGALMIKAGCRYFDIDTGREHWRTTRGGTPLGDETMAILDYIERVAAIRGMWTRPALKEAAGE